MSRKFTYEEVFKADSLYPRHRIKPRLIELGVPYKCNRCGISDWQGQVISLHLDHINGVYNDNRFENLQFLCPNCHSQTETYAGKNTKGVRRVGKTEKVKVNFRAEKLKHDQALWETVKTDPSIKFGQWGWVGRVSKLLNITPQKVNGWITRVDPGFIGV